MLCSFLGKGLRVESDEGHGTTFTFSVKNDKPATPELRKRLEKSYSTRRMLSAKVFTKASAEEGKTKFNLNAMKIIPDPNEKLPILNLKLHEETKRIQPQKQKKRLSTLPLVAQVTKRQALCYGKMKSLFLDSEFEEKQYEEDTSEFSGNSPINQVKVFGPAKNCFAHKTDNELKVVLPQPVRLVRSTKEIDKTPTKVKRLENPVEEEKIPIAQSVGAGARKCMPKQSETPPLKEIEIKALSFYPGEDIEDNKKLVDSFARYNQQVSPLNKETKKNKIGKYSGSLQILNHPCECPIVLIADDNEINKIALSGMLNRLGLIHLESSNGAEALEIIKKQNRKKSCCPGIKLVLMDCDMPVMDGITATKEIRKEALKGEINYPNIVAVSAFEGTSIEKECFDVGMKEYLSKPVDIEKLYDCIRRYLTN